MSLLRILVKHQLEQLFLFSELLHQEAGHTFKELVTEVLVEQLELLVLFFLRLGWSTELALEEASDVLFGDLLLLLVFFLEHLDLVFDLFFLKLVLLAVASAGKK